MAPTNGYCTTAELKSRLTITDTTDDTMLDQIITAVCRWIDGHCGRRFYTTSSDETRYYTASESDSLDASDGLDDVVSITTLKTDGDGDRTYETTWATTDYDLEPVNASLDGLPYTRMSVTPAGRYAFPTVRKGVQIVGKFGLTTAPAPVKDACLLMSERIYKRKDAVFGVMGSADMGQVLVLPKADPDVLLMLSAYRKFAAVAA